jgi:hypothetical protein
MAPLLKEFGDDEMFESLRELRTFYDANGHVLLTLSSLVNHAIATEESVSAARTYVHDNEPRENMLGEVMMSSIFDRRPISPIAIARRRVDFYFERCWRLREGGFINDRALAVLTNNDAFDLFVSVARPLSHAVALIVRDGGDAELFTRRAGRTLWHHDLGRRIGRNAIWRAPT